MGLFKNLIKAAAGFKEIEFHVAGVTFTNDDGQKRQRIIRSIKWHDKPFKDKVEITFERYEFQDRLAIRVLANGLQIGNVPKEMLAEFDEKWTGRYMIESYEVLGSDHPFGFRIKVLFDK